MDKKQIKLVLFGSGDFPVSTFEFLASNYDVVGVVTSDDKCIFGVKRVYDVAIENNIPVYIPKNLEDDEFLEWLDWIGGNVYCVISYKYLPKCVVDKAEFAFNVHASLLPVLKGAAPINWALRYGMTETGLTVIGLDEKIDCGKIYGSYPCDISDDDNFETLFGKLSHECVHATCEMMGLIEKETLPAPVYQPCIPKEYDAPVFHAPKLNIDNTTVKMFDLNSSNRSRELYNMIRSLSPNIGATFNMNITKWVETGDEFEFGGEFADVKNMTFKVYDASLVKKGQSWINIMYKGSDIITDWKHYMYIVPNLIDDYVVSVNRIQVSGKKILDIEDFLKGFQVYNKKDYFFNLA